MKGLERDHTDSTNMNTKTRDKHEKSYTENEGNVIVNIYNFKIKVITIEIF